MARLTLSSLRRVAALLDFFVPPNIREEGGEDAVRSRTAVGMALLASAVFVVMALLRLAAARWVVFGLNSFLAVTMAAFPVLLLRTGRLRLLVNGALFLAFAAFVAMPVVSLGGGLTMPAMGLAMVPLLAVLLVGMRAGFVWLVLTCLASAAIGILAGADVIAHRRAETLTAEHVAIVVAAVLLYVVGGLYEYRRILTLQQIARLEERRHRAERERLAAVAEAKLAEAERLASLGEIAAMAAHEINNPLSYVANNLEFLERRPRPSEHESLEALRDARDGVSRIQRIVEDLQQYGRPERDEVAVADVRAALETALKTVEGHTRPRARIVTELGPVPSVAAPQGRLVQVLLNLILNAAQAIPEGHAEENEIRIVARTAGDRVFIEIRDTGPGIPEEILGRVKETFFTTKTGRGSGLGLALSERILGRFGGELHLANGERGAVATVTLFGVACEPALERPRAPSVPAAPGVRRRILIVDDEPLVARALARHLREHEVRMVASGREALRVLDSAQPFDAILCDMMMPDLTGMDVFASVRERRPDLEARVIFMTGGTFTDRMRHFRETVKNPFLQKPVDVHALTKLLGDLPASAGTPSSLPAGTAFVAR